MLDIENNYYTLADIAQFLIDYKKSNQYISKEWVGNIPVIGNKFYEKTILENSKRTFFERKFNEVLNSSKEEQNEFIKQMTPILDKFYSNLKKKLEENNYKNIKLKFQYYMMILQFLEFLYTERKE